MSNNVRNFEIKEKKHNVEILIHLLNVVVVVKKIIIKKLMSSYFILLLYY